MKQQFNGKRIINWRKPFDRRRLSRRFVRSRDADVDVWSGEVDEYWNPLRPFDSIDDDAWCWEADQGTIAAHHLDNLVRSVLDHPSPLRSALEGRSAEAELANVDGVPTSEITVEERLATYVGELDGVTSTPEVVRQRINNAINNFRELDVIKLEAERLGSPTLAANVCLFAPFWIRSPLSWDRRTALATHVFARSDVPECLQAAWLSEFADRFSDEGNAKYRLKWMVWFIVLGQGGDLARAGQLLGWDIAAGYGQFLYRVPDGASFAEAALLAEIARVGGSAADQARIVAHSALKIDPTDVEKSSLDFRTFWRDAVTWVVDHGSAVTDDECETILAWGVHEFGESQGSGSRFMLGEYGVESAVSVSTTWDHAHNRSWFRYRWQAHGLSWESTHSDRVWSFVELTSGTELRREGLALDHCVADYAGRCAVDVSAIVSLRVDGVPRLTIEVHPQTRRIVQVRGLRNRAATSQEREIVRRWAGEVLGSP